VALDYIARRLAAAASSDPGARDRLTALASGLDPASEAGIETNAVRLAAEGDPDAAQELIQQGLARYPGSDVLRYEYIKPWLTRLDRGAATHEVVTQAAKLTASAGAVVRATALATDRKWDELAMLDGMLASARWSDPWKLDSVDLRLQWRLHLEASAELRRSHADEALGIIDEAVVMQPAVVLYALRVQSALAARRPEAVVESVWEYGHGLFANSQGRPQPERLQARATLLGLLQLLNAQSGAEPARLAEVRARLLADTRQLSLVTSTESQHLEGISLDDRL
jgi:hypothetical protein